MADTESLAQRLAAAEQRIAALERVVMDCDSISPDSLETAEIEIGSAEQQAGLKLQAIAHPVAAYTDQTRFNWRGLDGGDPAPRPSCPLCHRWADVPFDQPCVRAMCPIHFGPLVDKGPDCPQCGTPLSVYDAKSCPFDPCPHREPKE